FGAALAWQPGFGAARSNEACHCEARESGPKQSRNAGRAWSKPWAGFAVTHARAAHRGPAMRSSGVTRLLRRGFAAPRNDSRGFLAGAASLPQRRSGGLGGGAAAQAEGEQLADELLVAHAGLDGRERRILVGGDAGVGVGLEHVDLALRRQAQVDA